MAGGLVGSGAVSLRLNSPNGSISTSRTGVTITNPTATIAVVAVSPALLVITSIILRPPFSNRPIGPN